MTNPQTAQSFQSNYEKLVPIISEALNQLFMKEFSVSLAISDEENMAVAITGVSFPSVKVELTSVSNTESKHIILLDSSLGVKLYAWMIGDEAEGEMGDAQIEGLSEALNQITSQVQVFLQNDDIDIEFNSIQLTVENDSTALLDSIPEDGGLLGTYTVDVNDESFSINHFIWNVGPGLNGVLDDLANDANPVGVAPAEFDSFMTGAGGAGDPESMDLLLDVELEVVAELGKKTFQIKDLLKIGTGSVVELDKSAGEPLDLLINGRKFGEGEVVVVEDHFGIRITQLAGKKDHQ